MSLLPPPHYVNPLKSQPFHYHTTNFRIHQRRYRLRHLQINVSLHDFIKTLVSTNPVNLLPSSLALVPFSNNLSSINSELVVADWILFASPSPFNRYVFGRCPNINCEDNEGRDKLRPRISRPMQHQIKNKEFENVINGRVLGRDLRNLVGSYDFEYQRVCVQCEDGGVISLDWPENLEIEKMDEMDVTVVVVAGDAEGSLGDDLRWFVGDVIRNGHFPIVVNPRGCGQSPLTTPRLFTAADSDDISTAIDYINEMRPGSTLVSVGFGYGAIMLTKYLSEVEGSTPITSAACIDCPFDLEETTRSSPHSIQMNEKLLGGLIQILQANKELFHGKAKEFDIAKALSATSIRDFDEAISMLSFGFDNVSDFYSMTNARKLIPKLKVPVLFLQNDDETVPLFTVPRSGIAKNPFTSLLLLSSHRSTKRKLVNSGILWCQQLTIQWLSAVELALMKGRHPLLRDTDIAIRPPKGTSLISSADASNRTMKLVTSETSGNFVDDFSNVIDDKVNSSSNSEGLGTMLMENPEDEQDAKADASEESTTDAQKSVDLQTATVIMNMLDVTMPGTLDEERKEKVLSAMEQGKTLITALDGAVPVDVREKLKSAVSEIMLSPETNFEFHGLNNIDWIQNVISEKSNADDTLPSDQGIVTENDSGTEDITESAPNINDESEKATQASGIDTTDEKIEETTEPAPKFTEDSQEGTPQTSASSESVEKLQESTESAPINKEAVSEENGEETPQEISDSSQENVPIEKSIDSSETREADSPVEENIPISSSDSEEPRSTDSPEYEHQLAENSSEIQVSESKNNQEVEQSVQISKQTEENASKPPPSIAQAVDALTGCDDSTHMAVNSVFGVLEGMIDKLDKENTKDGKEEKNNEENHNEAKINDEMTCTMNNVLVNSGKGLEANIHKHMSSEINVGLDKENSTGLKNTESKQLNVVGHAPVDSSKPIQTAKPLDLDPTTDLKTGFKNIESKQLNMVGHAPVDFSEPVQTAKPLDLDSTTNLVLDQEEGQWKMNTNESGGNENRDELHHIADSNIADIIEPSYVIVDNELLRYKVLEELFDKDDSRKKEIAYLIKNNFLQALRTEFGRILGMHDLECLESNLIHDVDQFSDAVSHAIVHENMVDMGSGSERADTDQHIILGKMEAADVIKTISSTLSETSHLRKAIPSGVIVDACLASLRTYFLFVPLDDHHNGSVDKHKHENEIVNAPAYMKDQHVDSDSLTNEASEESLKNDIKNGGIMVGAVPLDDDHNGSVDKHRHENEVVNAPANTKDQHVDSDSLTDEASEESLKNDIKNGGIMVGAVTAALGASALVVHQQQGQYDQSTDSDNVQGSNESTTQEKNQLVSSFAEKAMSVVGPVVPTTTEGEVDQDRLVGVLVEVGQKGGMLRLVGKAALLWGGIRGAMSLTNKLITFSHLAERPLHQRFFGFIGMALVLWSPVAIPFLPTIVQSWTANSPNVIVEYTCILGLYASVTLLVVLWGRRIREYENPLQKYGLELTPASRRINDFLKGLAGGIIIVLGIHSINSFLGYAKLSWPGLLSSNGSLGLFKLYGSTLLLAIRALFTAAGISVVEELLFRSWLADEIGVDLGYYRAILLSALAFSLSQRSLPSIPGIFLLSLALSGMKQRNQGNLAAPIGMRAGIMTTNFFLQNGGFLKYPSNTPFWIASNHVWHPFEGAVGICSCALLAFLFFPKPVQVEDGS